MKKIFLTPFLFLFSNFYSQDIVNDYVSWVHVYFDNFAHDMPESICDWYGGTEGDGEFRLRLDIWDGSQDFHSPSSEESGWYIGDCFKESDADGWFNLFANHTIYQVQNTNYAQRILILDSELHHWEEDGCGSDDRYNTCVGNSDDCLYEISGSNVTISSSNKYGNTEYLFENYIYDLNGFSNSGGYNNYDINYQFEINPNIGTQFNNTFNFIDFDNVSDCFSEVRHTLNTSNRTSNNVYYKFTLSNYRCIEIDYSNQNPASNISDLSLYNSLTQLISYDDFSSAGIKSYYNLSPGTYYIKITRSNSFGNTGKYEIKINQIVVSDPTVTAYWNGCKNDNWSDDCNWSTRNVPTNNVNVYIRNTTNSPRIYTPTQAECNSIDIETGTNITVESSPIGTAKLNINH